jgi:hypothetical protein
MIQETRDWRTLLAHRHDQPTATPDPFGRTPASPREIADVIHNPNIPSVKQLRRAQRRGQGQ